MHGRPAAYIYIYALLSLFQTMHGPDQASRPRLHVFNKGSSGNNHTHTHKKEHVHGYDTFEPAADPTQPRRNYVLLKRKKERKRKRKRRSTVVKIKARSLELELKLNFF